MKRFWAASHKILLSYCLCVFVCVWKFNMVNGKVRMVCLFEMVWVGQRRYHCMECFNKNNSANTSTSNTINGHIGTVHANLCNVFLPYHNLFQFLHSIKCNGRSVCWFAISFARSPSAFYTNGCCWLYYSVLLVCIALTIELFLEQIISNNNNSFGSSRSNNAK